MEFLYAVVWILMTSLMLILVPILLFLAKLFCGKSIRDPSYPPVKGSIFSMIRYISALYDHQTEIAKTCHTYRLVALHESHTYTTDVRNIEYVLKTKFDKYTKGSYNVDVLTDLFGKGIFLVDGEKWRHPRKLASVEFSTRVLRDYSCSVFRKCSAKLVRAVSNAAISRQAFDIQELLMRCTMDSIFQVGFGVELNCLEESSAETTAFGKAFDELNALVYRRYMDPIWKIKRFLNIGSESLIKKNIDIVNNFTYGVIRAKREQMKSQNSNEKEDILSRFLVESEKDPGKMNDEYLKDIILNFMIAGKDSSAVTLSWFFYVLCKNPLVQEKILLEIGDALAIEDTEKDDADSFIAKIDEVALEKMQYLHAALSEALRLYPAVPVDGRCAEENDTLPDGYKVRKGDGVYYMAYAMGRMPYIWGEDAEDFKPERWIENGGFQQQSPFKFITFHAGPRICLGKEFAYRQMKIISIALLWFFRFKLADETKTVKYKTMVTLHIDGGLHVQAIPRTSYHGYEL